MKLEIYIKRTGIHLYHYKKHLSLSLEKYLSIFDIYKKKYYMYLFNYDNVNKILKIPRIPIYALKSKLNADNIDYTIVDISNNFILPVYNDIRFKEEYTARNQHQKRVIDVLINEKDQNRKIIALATGVGKTFCALKAVEILKNIPIIICGMNLLKQWAERLLEYSYCKKEDFYFMSGLETVEYLEDCKERYKFYFVTPQTLLLYLDANKSLNALFSKLGIGIKIIDEIHTFLNAIVKIESNVDIKHNWYLSATPGRTQMLEEAKFKQIFKDVGIYGEYTRDLHNHYNVVYIEYNSYPTPFDTKICSTVRGFNTKIYFKYLFHDYLKKKKFIDMIIHFLRLFYKKNSGKVLIYLDRLSDIKEIGSILENVLDKSIGIYCGLVNKKIKQQELDNDIILTTLKSASAGLDLKDLQLILSLTSFTSRIYSIQVRGRLRDIGKEVYLFDFCDMGFPDLIKQRNKRKVHFNKNSKTIKTFIYKE